MKYYNSWEVSIGSVESFASCAVCGKKCMLHRFRIDDKQLVCESCFQKDEDKEIVEK